MISFRLSNASMRRPKLGVATLGRHEQRLHGALEVGRERRAHGVRVVLAAAGNREPLQRPARLAGDEGLVLQARRRAR
jgi:hypothetical protein